MSYLKQEELEISESSKLQEIVGSEGTDKGKRNIKKGEKLLPNAEQIRKFHKKQI